MKHYKARIYHTSGLNKGNLKEEKYFDTLEDLLHWYNEIFTYELFSLNPTIWKYEIDLNEWYRLNSNGQYINKPF